MTYREAAKYIKERHDEYVGYIEDGLDEEAAMDATLDGIGDPNDLFKLIWGGGALDKALEASWDTIEQAVLKG